VSDQQALEYGIRPGVVARMVVLSPLCGPTNSCLSQAIAQGFGPWPKRFGVVVEEGFEDAVRVGGEAGKAVFASGGGTVRKPLWAWHPAGVPVTGSKSARASGTAGTELTGTARPAGIAKAGPRGGAPRFVVGQRRLARGQNSASGDQAETKDNQRMGPNRTRLLMMVACDIRSITPFGASLWARIASLNSSGLGSGY